ncbi:amino acid ABC transporter substrate-binding protein (PAAT family) [Dongia mobilis]|uniref:Amino acid ABC transporter substrate-binding protein (PAAT family) n=1 Tax=Dongia mobilis TaxID=578943 RepID=A0A4V3DED5_9PROT|nr:amino acid ABC transporter substrate-binding protein [Dongia mobilis]TDQ80862.1 amino acid ABC transporter substrate-binding protein (PAAT family) [Dongia mobilis]
MTSRIPIACRSLLAVLLISVFTAPALADVLGDIKSSNAIRLAVRADAPPFSSADEQGKYQGYSVALCEAVVDELRQALQLPDLGIEYVPVTAENRFDAIADGKADLLCEATTATLARREKVDFSVPTFMSGAGLIIRPDGPQDIYGLAGKKVGVLDGTTTEDSLRITLEREKITADVVPVGSHLDGLAALERGETDAYFADRTILLFLMGKNVEPGKLLIADNFLSIEPYALAMKRGDDDMRLAVDRALSHLYRSKRIATIFTDSFGPEAKPTSLQRSLYTISALPE